MLQEIKKISKESIEDGIKNMFSALLGSKEIIKKLEEAKVLCFNCGHWETLRIKPEFSTLRCKCGCTVYYPPSKDRPFGAKRFISAKEYLFNKEVEKEYLKRDLENKGIKVTEVKEVKKE